MPNRRRRSTNLAAALVKGALAGAAATWVMEQATTYLYEHENRSAREREDEARRGKHAFAVAAEKTAALTGVHLSETQQQGLGLAYHWDSAWAPGCSTAHFADRSAGSIAVREPSSAFSSSCWSTRA